MAMRHAWLVGLVMALGLGGLRVASASDKYDGWDPRPVTSIRYFTDARYQLQFLVNAKGFYRVNHFCVIVGGDDGGAEVYWPTEGKMIDWEPSIIWHDPVLAWSRQYVDIKHETIPTDADRRIWNMAFPLTMTDVNATIHDCSKWGTKFTIYKSYGGWVPISRYPRFRAIRMQLQTLVDDKAYQKKNKFCVIGQKDGDYLVAYVHWKTEGELLMRNPDPEDYDAPQHIEIPYIRVNLKTDVVDREHYVRQWETDLMPKPFAHSILNACKKFGEEFTIMKNGTKVDTDE